MMTITATDLTLGQAARPGNAAHRATPDVTALMHRADLAEQRLADLKVMLEEMKAQRDDVLRDRDHWRGQAERLALHRPERKPQKMSPWSWMRLSSTA